jgi:hypothetical protein
VRTAAGIAAYTVPAPRAADSARVGFVAADPPRRDSLGDRVAARSWYRTPDHQVRPSADGSGARSLGIEPLSVTALLDSAALALPDPERFRDAPYRAGFQPEYIAQPQVGVGMASNYGQALYGGTTIVLSDLLGNQQLAIAGGVNGTIQDAQVYVGYTSLARRLQYTTGVSQLPLYFVGSGGSETRTDGSTVWSDNVVRFAYRDAFWRALYPLDRFTRFELGGRLTNVGRSLIPFTSTFDAGGALVGQQRGRAQGLGSATMVAPSLAFVRDDALFGYTSPIMGSRLRFSVEPQVGTWRWVDYVLDYRRYDPVLFNFLTIATRVSASLTAGRDEGQVPKYIGRPDLVRGYNRDPIAQGCGSPAATERLCAGQQLLGSRVAFMNAEVRFPVVRRFDLGVLPITLPPVDGLVFYDMGVAWTGQSRDGQATQRLLARRPASYDLTQQRYPLRSYGYGIRFNLFGFMIVRWDYAWPLDGPNRRAYGTWFVGPSF